MPSLNRLPAPLVSTIGECGRHYAESSEERIELPQVAVLAEIVQEYIDEHPEEFDEKAANDDVFIGQFVYTRDGGAVDSHKIDNDSDGYTEDELGYVDGESDGRDDEDDDKLTFIHPDEQDW